MSFGQAVLHSAPSHYTVISTITLAPSPDRTMTRDKVRVPQVPSNHISGKRTSTSHSKCPPPTIANLTPNPWRLKKNSPPVSSMHSGFCFTQRPAVRIEDRTKPDFIYHCARRAEIGNCGHSNSIRSDTNSADLNTRQRRSNGPKVLIPLNNREMLRRLSLSINLSVHVIADTLYPQVNNTVRK